MWIIVYTCMMHILYNLNRFSHIDYLSIFWIEAPSRKLTYWRHWITHGNVFLFIFSECTKSMEIALNAFISPLMNIFKANNSLYLLVAEMKWMEFHFLLICAMVFELMGTITKKKRWWKQRFDFGMHNNQTNILFACIFNGKPWMTVSNE